MKQTLEKQHVVTLSAEVHQLLKIRAAEKTMQLRELANLILRRELERMGKGSPKSGIAYLRKAVKDAGKF